MSARLLVVGDIHGFWVELQALLDKAGIGSGDGVVALGDFVDRGPDTPAVLNHLRQAPGARAIMGNHELKHLRAARGEVRLARSQTIARHQLGDAYEQALVFLATLPYYLETPDAVLVHAFLEPGVPLDQQDERILAGTTAGERLLAGRCPDPWYEAYDGAKPLVVAHQNYTGTRQPFVYRDRVFGLDTDCCHGGALTGLLLPEYRFVQVPSTGDHWRETLDLHRHLFAVQEAEQYDRDVQILVDHIHVLRDGFLAQLREEPDFDTAPAREQARRYATLVGDSPLAASLFAARTHDVGVERMRLVAPTLDRLHRLMRLAGLSVDVVDPERESTNPDLGD